MMALPHFVTEYHTITETPVGTCDNLYNATIGIIDIFITMQSFILCLLLHFLASKSKAGLCGSDVHHHSLEGPIFYMIQHRNRNRILYF
jgi:hypothetical protein